MAQSLTSCAISRCPQKIIKPRQVKHDLIETITDPGNQRRWWSRSYAPHPLSFPLGWIQKDVEEVITKQCTFNVAITKEFIDEETCNMVPMYVCQVIFGSPYLWDQDVVFYHKLQKYQLFKNEIEYHIHVIKDLFPIACSLLLD